MNSRWQANKIGLINFWYYDEQEFHFVKGRMLLRGSNGSGKSVTMQSVVPLLLDGNMSPERLDPFGSRDRKMNSYLLEEDDKREERTGYLYLEFRRQESDTYLTIGMGIRARRGKPLDKWYFSLTDGKRIGKDFFLYKQTDEKVTLSKKELEYRLQDGGQVFEKQSDYMEYVNRQIFGFETVEEYKEMIDLLIQLRTPKLSKDFKPSVINDILSDSLQPLSDEDLRPMSEAIENMDTLNMNLKARQEAKQAAEKINRILDRYNRLILFEKADHYVENQKKLGTLEQEEADRRHRIEVWEQRVLELDGEQLQLDAKKEALEKERESLSNSNAVALKSRELELRTRIADEETQLREKERQLSAKQEQYLELEERQKKGQDEAYKKRCDLESLLDEMQTEAEEMSFDEHTFFRNELEEHLDASYGFSGHQELFEKTRQRIEDGLKILQQVELQKRQVDDLMQKREKNQKETDGSERRVNELESMLVQVQNEWKEALYQWNGSNQELVLEHEQMKQLAQFAETYGETSDFAMVKKQVSDGWIRKNGVYQTRLQQNVHAIEELQEVYDQIRRELNEWENHKEPEPPRSEAVLKNRARLEQLGIPYQPFYQVLEFGQELTKTDCDRLEEALLYMGILDALIIDEEYKEQVLQMDPGCCDRYLFARKQSAERSILDVLDLNDSVNDLFFNQKVTGILRNIAYDSDGVTNIAPDGTYQIGVLTGTVTGEYEAGFLGTRAREENRQAKIRMCQQQLAQIEAQQEQLQQEVVQLKERCAQLDREYETLPGDGDLRTAWNLLQEARRLTDRLREEGRALEQQLKAMTIQLNDMQREAMQIAEKLCLTCTYEVFRRAESAARTYHSQFHELKSGHAIYLQLLQYIEDLRERMEHLDGDLEQIRYEMGMVTKGLKKEQEEYQSVQEQLKLTNYEEIKERLDACIEWLRDYSVKLQSCIEEKAQKAEQIRNLQEQIKQGTEKIQETRRRNGYLQKCYEAEYALSYVEDVPKEAAEHPELVQTFLEGTCGNLQKETVIQELNRIYFENRSFLMEYQLTQKEQFEELEEQAQRGDPPAKRLDILARYQGTQMPFSKLLFYLEVDIAELQDLIQAGDRELFEDILANTISRKIRSRIHNSNVWVEKMNALMGGMNTSSGLKLSLRWRSKTAEQEDQLDTRELVELLKKDYRLMREEEAAKLSQHFRSKVEQARKYAKDGGGTLSFYQVMKETLDYRKWFEFQLFSQKSGEKQRELTNSVFGTFSGGEKAMSMYVPLFSAVVAKYQGGREDAPRLISLDEAFAGVDNKNICDMFRLMTEFQFDFIMNSQVLWGDYETLDALAIYQLMRPGNARFVTVMAYLWNGKGKELLESTQSMEEAAKEYYTENQRKE